MRDSDSLYRLVSGAAEPHEYLAELNRMRVLYLDLVRARGYRLCHDPPIPEFASLDALYTLLQRNRAFFGTAFSSQLAWTHPQWVLALGYDEMRFSDRVTEGIQRRGDILPATGVGILTNMIQCPFCSDSLRRAADATPFYRQLGGAWVSTQEVFDCLLPTELSQGADNPMSTINCHLATSWAEAVESAVLDDVTKFVAMPAICFASESFEHSSLRASIRGLLEELSVGAKSLRSLHWRELEEVVAELLRAMGFDVAVTPRARDGGRDVIARGELLPGESSVLAVEVKQMASVGLGQLREALWANRHFPALLFATSGQFSAGVFQERLSREMRMRLLLKDGIALGQWVDDYIAGRLVQTPGRSVHL